MTGLERNTNNNKIATYLGYINERQDSAGRIYWYQRNEFAQYFVGREDELKFDISYDALFPVIHKIHNTYYKKGIEGRTFSYTMNYLLNGGYKFNSESPLPNLEFSLENLYSRVIMFIDWYNKITEK